MTKILLVEDQDDHADIVTRALAARKGWAVTRALTVKEALLHAALKPFDVAIVDYQLPDGDGIDLLDSLRAQKPGLPVVFLTAHGSEEVAMQAMSRGAADYLVKGLHYQKELPNRVQAVLERSEDLARVAAAVRNSAQAAAVPQGGRHASGAGGNGFDAKGLARVVRGLVAADTLGAAVFDGEGRPVAAKLPEGVDAATFGGSLVATVLQAQHTVKQLPESGTPRVVLIDYELGLLACAPVPGPALVVLLLDAGIDRAAAVKKCRDAAHQVWEHSKA